MAGPDLPQRLDDVEQKKAQLIDTPIQDLAIAGRTVDTAAGERTEVAQGREYGDLGNYAQRLMALYKESLKDGSRGLPEGANDKLSKLEKGLEEEIAKATDILNADVERSEEREKQVLQITLKGIEDVFGQDFLGSVRAKVAQAKQEAAKAASIEAELDAQEQTTSVADNFVPQRDLNPSLKDKGGEPPTDVKGQAVAAKIEGPKVDKGQGAQAPAALAETKKENPPEQLLVEFGDKVKDRASLNAWLDASTSNREKVRDIVLNGKDVKADGEVKTVNFDALAIAAQADESTTDAIIKNLSIGNLFTPDEISRIARVEPGNGRSPVDLTDGDKFLTGDIESKGEGAVFKKGLYKKSGDNQFAYTAIFNGAQITFGKEASKVSKVEDADKDKFIASIERPSAVVGKGIAEKGDDKNSGDKGKGDATANPDKVDANPSMELVNAAGTLENQLKGFNFKGRGDDNEASKKAFAKEVATICLSKGIKPEAVNFEDIFDGKTIEYKALEGVDEEDRAGYEKENQSEIAKVKVAISERLAEAGMEENEFNEKEVGAYELALNKKIDKAGYKFPMNNIDWVQGEEDLGRQEFVKEVIGICRKEGINPSSVNLESIFKPGEVLYTSLEQAEINVSQNAQREKNAATLAKFEAGVRTQVAELQKAGKFKKTEAKAA